MTARPGGRGEYEVRVAGDPVLVRLLAGRLTVHRADGSVVREVHLDDVHEVRRAGERVEVEIERGGALTLEAGNAAGLDAAIVDACCTLPELTRGLHSLGSSRARQRADGQREFLAPLLEARRRAEESVGRASIVAAFDAERIVRALDAYLDALVERSSDPRPAARRALAAAAREAVEPLRTALDAVRRTAGPAGAPEANERVGSWRRWREALQALFAAADRSWSRLAAGTAAQR